MIKKDRLVQTFLELVSIDSPSGSEEAMAKEMVSRLKKLGAAVQQDDYGNVIGFIDGVGKPFMVNAHLDTVEPGRGIKPIVDGDIIKTDGTTILGADPKAGVAAILEATESIIESKKKHAPINFVFTLGEEVGLLGAINLDYSKVRAKQGITFDGGELPQMIHIASPGYMRVDVTITGRSAHAGAEPEKGISAIKIAADMISGLQVGRIDHETTANVGLISGGSARNAVPETVEFSAEIRSRNLDKLQKHTYHFNQVIETVMKKYSEAKIKLVMEKECDPYHFDDLHPMIKKVTEACTKLKLKPQLHESGGGTDVNIFHTHGIEALCLGTGEYEAHTTREYVKISEMVLAAKLCEQLLLI